MVKGWIRATIKDFPNPQENPQNFKDGFRILIGAYDLGLPDLCQLIHMTLGPGNAQKWMSDAKAGDPESHIKDPRTNCSASGGSKGARKIAWDLLESIVKIFSWKTGLSISLANKKRTKPSQTIRQNPKPCLWNVLGFSLLNKGSEDTLPSLLISKLWLNKVA